MFARLQVIFSRSVPGPGPGPDPLLKRNWQFCLHELKSHGNYPGTRLRTGGKGSKNKHGRKNKSVSEASREKAERKYGPFPPPQATARLASLADIFPI